MIIKCIQCENHLHAPYKTWSAEDLCRFWSKNRQFANFTDEATGEWKLLNDGQSVWENENDARYEGICPSCQVKEKEKLAQQHSQENIEKLNQKINEFNQAFQMAQLMGGNN